MDFIFIDDMRVEAHVGIYDRERVAPQTLDLSLTFGVRNLVPESAVASVNDKLNNASYGIRLAYLFRNN